MEAKYIYPEDMELNQWSSEWAKLCSLFGYNIDSPPSSLILVNIKAVTSNGNEI